MAAFDNVQTAGDAVGGVIAKGIIPAGLEMMDSPAIIAAEAFAHAGYPTDAQALLLCEPVIQPPTATQSSKIRLPDHGWGKQTVYGT